MHPNIQGKVSIHLISERGFCESLRHCSFPALSSSNNPVANSRRSVHRGFVGVSLGQEVFTDLDFADDVSVMAEMLEVLILALELLIE